MLSAARIQVGRNRPIIAVVVVFIVVLAVLTIVFKRQAIDNDVTSGQIIHAQFASDYELTDTSGLAPASKVKIAGSPVGLVTGIKSTSHGTVVVTLKINTHADLGSAPSATVRPTTLLGGNYYVQLTPGGSPGRFDGSSIPLNRTHLPVELDRVLQAFPHQTQGAIRTTTAELNGSLEGGGSQALNQVLSQAPKTLVPTASVVQSALGTIPASDLPQLVTDLNNTAVTLNAKSGQLGNVLDLLNQTTTALGQESAPVKETLAGLPQTLSTTRTGLTALGGTLTQLTSTAAAARPSIERINPLLTALNPVLLQLKPLLNQVQPVLQQARPLVSQLVPTSKNAITVLNEVKGPVLKDINGPIVNTLMNNWYGRGIKYGKSAYNPAGDGNDNLGLISANKTPRSFYQEVGYFVVNLDRSCQKYAGNGFFTNLDFTAGTGSVPVGVPKSIAAVINQFLSVAIPDGGGTS